MARRKSKGNNRRRRRSSGPSRSIAGVDRTTTIVGKVLLPIVTNGTPTNTTTIIVNPAFMDAARLTQLGQSFELFRFVSINLRMYPVADAAGTARSSMVMMYSRLDFTPPATVDVAYVAPVSRYIDTYVTVPVSMRLSRADLLHSTNPWWSTNVPVGSASNPAANTTQQGYIHFVSAVEGDTTVVEVSYVVQFRSASTAVDDFVDLTPSRLNGFRSAAPVQTTPPVPAQSFATQFNIGRFNAKTLAKN